MNLFAKNLRFLRKNGGYNQDEISILFNKRANTVGNWENQKSEPNLSEVMKLSAFFHVSTQELLHADLEKESILLNGEKPVGEESRFVPKPYPMADIPPDAVHESNPDAFWLILRELKSVNEKLDLLSASVQSGAFTKHSDKSYH